MSNMIPFGNACTLQNGKAFKPSDWSNNGIPIVRIQNLNDESKPFNYCETPVEERFHIDSGDLLFSWSGTPGTSFGAFFWNRGEAYLNQHIFKVGVDENEVNKNYLRYAINSKLIQIIDQAHGGVGLKHITKGKLEAIEIPLPPLPEQKRIAAILDKADAIRRKRQQAIDLADEFLRSVFLDMFGDPITNLKKWKIGTIRDLVSEAKYGSSQKASETKGEFPILRMGNITYRGGWDFTALKYVDLSEKDQEKYIVEQGDILFNRTNSKELVGKTAVYESEDKMAAAGYLIRVRTNDCGNPYYISSYLNSKHGKQTLQGMCKNIVGMANINAQEMQNIKIMLPPNELQDTFAQITQSVHLKIKIQKKSLFEMNCLFNSLSQQAFSGFLSISKELDSKPHKRLTGKSRFHKRKRIKKKVKETYTPHPFRDKYFHGIYTLQKTLCQYEIFRKKYSDLTDNDWSKRIYGITEEVEKIIKDYESGKHPFLWEEFDKNLLELASELSEINGEPPFIIEPENLPDDEIDKAIIEIEAQHEIVQIEAADLYHVLIGAD